jgi:hypothetical protein
MRTRLEPAPWNQAEPNKDLLEAVNLISQGTWAEAATEFYAARLSALRSGKATPKGIQRFLNRVLDRRFTDEGWNAEDGRYSNENVWLRVTFRHQMSLGSDFIDALKVSVREGASQVAIAAASFDFLELISPNDKHVLTSFEKLRVETAALGGCLDIPLFIGRLEPASVLPQEVARFLQKERPRGR